MFSAEDIAQFYSCKEYNCFNVFHVQTLLARLYEYDTLKVKKTKVIFFFYLFNVQFLAKVDTFQIEYSIFICSDSVSQRTALINGGSISSMLCKTRQEKNVETLCRNRHPFLLTHIGKNKNIYVIPVQFSSTYVSTVTQKANMRIYLLASTIKRL